MIDTSAQMLRNRLPSLTGLRFVAAFLVFGTHVANLPIWQDPEVMERLQDIGQAGLTGVSFFFVLSGFVLTWSLRPHDTARGFWRRRAAKIIPNHVVTWAIVLGLLAFVAHPETVAGVTGDGTVLSLFMLHAWVPDHEIMFAVNSPSWSLSDEAFFYLSFPLLYLLLRRVDPKLLWPLFAAVAGAVMCMPLVAQLVMPEKPLIPFVNESLHHVWFVYRFPLARILEFAAGILMARIVLTGRWIRLPLAPAAALVVAAYLVMLQTPPLYQAAAVTIVPLSLLIGAAAVADVEGRFTFGLRSRPMVWLGDISFAFYMTHWIVLNFGLHAIGVERDWTMAWAMVFAAGAFASAVVASWLLYRFVEAPIMRKWSRPRGAALPKPVTPVAAQAD